MSHRDSPIKKNRELNKPMDLMNVGFVGTVSVAPTPATEHSSMYESFNPLTTVNKQHFVCWFSGKQTPRPFTIRNTNKSGASFTMNDSVDGGGRISTGSTADAKCAFDFNNKGMHYSPTGSVMLSVSKAVDINTNQGLKIYLTNTNTNEGGTSQFGAFYMTSSGLFIRHNGTNTSSGLSQDTSWHLWKFELTSSSGKVWQDGTLAGTVTTTLPSDSMQPSYTNTTGGAGGSRRQDVRYCEVYNT